MAGLPANVAGNLLAKADPAATACPAAGYRQITSRYQTKGPALDCGVLCIFSRPHGPGPAPETARRKKCLGPQVGDLLRCAAPMSYPCAGEMPMGGDEAARNTVQPSMRRIVPCCASPHRRDAPRRVSPVPQTPRWRPRRATHAMFPSARCCTR